jgi:hypothetical protein
MSRDPSACGLPSALDQRMSSHGGGGGGNGPPSSSGARLQPTRSTPAGAAPAAGLHGWLVHDTLLHGLDDNDQHMSHDEGEAAPPPACCALDSLPEFNAQLSLVRCVFGCVWGGDS